MYIEIVCKNDEMECIQCNKKIGSGNTFYGNTPMRGAPFHSPICNECVEDFRKSLLLKKMSYDHDDLKSDITTLLEGEHNKELIVSEIMRKIEFYEDCKYKH